ncbi:defensin-like protein 206 [Eutrema salsugineum]|uniref:defensin-like protein 206 n=1 Tax=Eutrema salsugineum TaxID=72664 RepID=UPI000CED497A|nr:defensin-like protein 206 [Eutrema salsugineum]
MAKNLNAVCFTVLLLVLVMASSGFLKSEAIKCGDLTCPPFAFHDECPAAHGTTDSICCDCCIKAYGSANICWAIIEGTDKHCHCYTKG